MKAELQPLVDLLVHQNFGISSMAWDVVTALRGPDNESYYESVTAVAAVPKLDQGKLRSELPEYAALRADLDRVFPTDHFLRHARKAFEVLGLKWGEVNP